MKRLVTALIVCGMIPAAAPVWAAPSSPELYEKVAPAVVLVHTDDDRGSGFLVSSDGWIVTNCHVVESASVRIADGVQHVQVYLGRMDDGLMKLDPQPLAADVYKVNRAKDLALLKLKSLPADRPELPYLKLADRAASPGNGCATIGHPRAGMLWTLRSGEVAGVGRWPDDMIHTVVARLSASQADVQRLERTRAATTPYKLLLSTCGMNPGDSGAPLVDRRGRVIGVNFARPVSGTGPNANLDKFSYHVHRDELHDFLRERPSQPEPFVPDPWPSSDACQLLDGDRNKVFDTLLFTRGPNKALAGYLLDLDEESSADFDPDQVGDPGMRAMWRFTFAVQVVPAMRTFYDTDNDGKIDLILTDANRDGIADIVLECQGGQWKVVQRKGQKMLDASLFCDQKLAERFARHFEKPAKGDKPT